jgi:hypothetical protein
MYGQGVMVKSAGAEEEERKRRRQAPKRRLWGGGGVPRMGRRRRLTIGNAKQLSGQHKSHREERMLCVSECAWLTTDKKRCRRKKTPERRIVVGLPQSCSEHRMTAPKRTKTP